MSICLFVKSGRDKGKKFAVKKNKIIIGRDKSADISVNDQTVSREHCCLRIEKNRVLLEDLNSSNNTYLNGEIVKSCDVVDLNDEILIGETLFAVVDTSSDYSALLNRNQPKTMVISAHNKCQDKLSSDLELMYKVNSAINSIRNKNKLIRTLLELIFEVIPARRGAILICDDKTGEMIPFASLSRDNDNDDDIYINNAIVEQVFKKKMAVLTTDASKDPRFEVIGNRIGSAMCVPMGTINNMFGVIHLEDDIESGAFAEKDLALLSAIANQSAIAIENMQFFRRLEDENKQLQQAIRQEYNMIGQSPKMKQIFSLIERLSNTESTVLVRGESGTGKELVARAIHYTSERKGKPFVCVNCAALNENLLESEIFGHEKGAFTGADGMKKGRFELADGGTIFLDEIGELNLESQVKLLRVLEEGKFERVGGVESVSVDVRILAATNKDLEKAIVDKLFRADLYYRLKVIQVDIPPLRERKEDIIPCAIFFLDKYREKVSREVLQFSPEVCEAMKKYHWPGNIRELKNCVERAVVLGNSNVILPEDLLFDTDSAIIQDGEFPSLQQVERDHIMQALKHTGWNKKKTADLLGIQRSTLYEKLRLYHISL